MRFVSLLVRERSDFTLQQESTSRVVIPNIFRSVSPFLATKISHEATPAPTAGVVDTVVPTTAPSGSDGTRGFLEGDNNGDGVVDSLDDING